MQKFEKTFSLNGEDITITMGNFGFRADSAVMVQKGETVVMVFVTVDSKESDLDYFPLSVNYMEKFYAGGVISGSRFIKREKRPSDDAIIKGRVIDRAMRPLFPDGFKRSVSIVINVMAYDEKNDPAILGANAASLAVHLSSIPFDGPVSSVKIGTDENGELIVDPDETMMKDSQLNAVISSTKDTITQLEIEGDEIPEEKMASAFEVAFEKAQEWNDIMEEIQKEKGKEKLEYNENKVDEELVKKYKKEYKKEIEKALFDDKNRNDMLDEIHNKAIEEKDEDVSNSDIINAFQYIEKSITREYLLEGKRLSGRDFDEIREIQIESPFLPRVHGSAMFRRGKTQALSITTLGSMRLAQMSESYEGESEKRYMHHYVGPNYSYGDAGRFSFYAGNREIGHGALAEKAVKKVLPSEEEFPYAIRVVSEILSQNGSTSMAATCGSCLALMDAGVPIKTPVAGISIGLITKDKEQKKYQLLTDVQDVEDFFGDMDFKVCGTKDGISAIQMDTKLKGVKLEILQEALKPAKSARLKILDIYKEVLPEPRSELKEYAPRCKVITINKEKIGDLIGPGGKTIKAILESVDNKVEINIEDDGQVTLTAVDQGAMKQAEEKINEIVAEPEIGKIYEGEVDKITSFGAFVDVSPAISGLVHISEITDGYVKDVSKHLKVGQKVKVKLIDIDNEGRLKLSMKEANKKKK
ncbi:polyribonucleotide nucleotidyltransferase [Candidatus Dojkabacteria bacterium]|nr:polyribonucleotide nucleotidyltransferase [Candidatus Dojkabacteria bacterium]